MQIENRLEWRKGMEELTLLGERAVQAKYELQRMTTERKNEVLEAVAEALIQNTEYLLLENHKDLERGIANEMNPALPVWQKESVRL